MKEPKFSISEIQNLITQLNLISLPNTTRAIQYRAEREHWEYEEAPSQGGKKGVKRIYPLPPYVIDELEQKGLLHLIDGAETDTPLEVRNTQPDLAHIENIDYADWAARQDTRDIVPVRYYKEVFASAGSGAIPWDTDPEAMWFRTAFFKHLQLSPADCFCTRIDGDSMFPTLIDQGTVLWQTATRYTREGIYLFRQQDELRVKRLQRLTADTLNIISDNPNKSIYPTTQLTLSATTPADFQILGKYLWSCGISK